MIRGPATSGQDNVPTSVDGYFEQFLSEQRPALIGFLHKRGVAPDDAQDVAQDAMLRLVRYRAQPADVLRPLLYRIALNALNDHLRRSRSRQQAAHFSMDEVLHDPPSQDPEHERRVAGEQELQLARRIILQMPERCRQVYLLNRVNEMSYSQIARHCGISVKAVEKNIARALTLLRRGLQQTELT